MGMSHFRLFPVKTAFLFISMIIGFASPLRVVKGWRNGESTRLLPISFPCLFPVGQLSLLVLVLAPRGFSLGTPVVPSPQKPTFPISNLIHIMPEGRPQVCQ